MPGLPAFVQPRKDRFHYRAAGFNAVDVEEIVNEPREAFAFVLDDVEIGIDPQSTFLQ